MIGYAPKSLHPKSALAASSGAGSPSLNSFAEVCTLAVMEGHNGDCVDLRQSCATPVKRAKTNHLRHYGPSSWETPPKVKRHEPWRSCASPPKASTDAMRAKPAVNPVDGEASASRAAQHYSLALPAVNHVDDAAHSPRPVVIPVDDGAAHFPLAQPAVNPVDGATPCSVPTASLPSAAIPVSAEAPLSASAALCRAPLQGKATPDNRVPPAVIPVDGQAGNPKPVVMPVDDGALQRVGQVPCPVPRSERLARSFTGTPSKAELLRLLDMLQGDVRVSDTLHAREKARSSGSYATSCSAPFCDHACFRPLSAVRAAGLPILCYLSVLQRASTLAQG